MAAAALAHGPWALLHSAELMRHLLGDLHSAIAAVTDHNTGTDGSNLYGVYATREAKPTHNRPLPLPDALLQGKMATKTPTGPDVDWLAGVIQSPWVWKLQWTTLAMLFASPELRALLMAHCPKPVAEKWLEPLERRLHEKMLGASVKEGLPGSTAALTPLMTVVSELIFLRMTYEL